MKIFIAALAVLILCGCTSSTQYGDCIGVFDERDPKLVYKLHAGNLVVAIIFSELIAPPVIVAVNETFCPVGKK